MHGACQECGRRHQPMPCWLVIEEGEQESISHADCSRELVFDSPNFGVLTFQKDRIDSI